jgi:phosphoribosylformylglycinamidine synthase PurS subunit
MKKVRVFVTLKAGVLDPAGKAVEGGLRHLGFDEVKGVRLGKLIELELDDGAGDERARIDQMCKKLLANTVIEDYRIDGAQ